MRFSIPLPPVGFQRPRPNPRGGFYSPHGPEMEDWRRLVTNQMRLNSESILVGPVSVELHIGSESTDISVSSVVGEQPRRPKGVRADLDNYVKAILDSLQGPAYFDDKQVVDLAARFKGE